MVHVDLDPRLAVSLQRSLSIIKGRGIDRSELVKYKTKTRNLSELINVTPESTLMD
jgi:hypothetical protein